MFSEDLVITPGKDLCGPQSHRQAWAMSLQPTVVRLGHKAGTGVGSPGLCPCIFSPSLPAHLSQSPTRCVLAQLFLSEIFLLEKRENPVPTRAQELAFRAQEDQLVGGWKHCLRHCQLASVQAAVLGAEWMHTGCSSAQDTAGHRAGLLPLRSAGCQLEARLAREPVCPSTNAVLRSLR